MATTLDLGRIRRRTPSQVRDYYKELRHDVSKDDCTRQLLDAIERGSIAPCPGWATWLGVTKSPSAIQLGIQQNFSVIVRADSIQCLGKNLCSARWKTTLDYLGGAPGLLSLFMNMSVNEVRDACKALGKCAKGSDVLEKRRCITELFMGLQPQVFPEASVTTTDRRPLGKHYRHLIPSCSEELVERIVSGDLKRKWEPVRVTYLMQYHPDVIRREQLRAMDHKSEVKIDQRRFQGLVTLYPQGLDTISGFSPSMEFAMSVLQNLSCGTERQLDDEIFINDLVQPLLRRALKKQIEWSKIEEIVNLTMAYLQLHPSARKEISPTEGGVYHLIAICWAYQPDMFETQLKRLCSDSMVCTETYNDLAEWTDFLDGIPKPRRYPLLRLCFLESAKLDLDSDDDLKLVKGSLQDALLDKLTPERAFCIFTRLRAARGDDDLLKILAGNSILNIGPAYHTTRSDVDLYHVVLLVRNGHYEEARMLASRQMDVRKRKAEKASEPDQRKFYARSALYYGVASGDLNIYQSALDWTKRFLRDPQVLPSLYPQYGYKREVIALLSGIPVARTKLTQNEVSARVRAGNAVLQSMFDTACSAIREPSFQSSQWQGTLDLFQQVTKRRIKRSEVLQHDLSASDEEMYSILWEDTLNLLLTVEAKANRSESARLEANTVCGPLGWRSVWSHGQSDFEPKSWSKYTYKFFNNLAKARDEFWRKQRSTVHPATMALPEPLTRGLPIQFLINPWILNTPDLELFAPYLTSRAESVVFQDPSAALQPVTDDEETADAIGLFIDSYQYALRLYIPESCSKEVRMRRIQKVWDHAVGPLSQDRMNKEEAVRWWKNKVPTHLQNHWPSTQESDTTHAVWPLIPDVDDPDQPSEWNPFEAGRPNCPKRDLGELTYLDLSVLSLVRAPDIAQIWTKSNLLESVPTVPADEVEKSQIWNSNRDMGDGGVLSALLYLEMMHGAPNGRLLQKPFPSAKDARYPCLYLDDGFQGDLLNQFNAVRHIKEHISNIPPALLHLSTRNMMSKLWALDHDEHDDHSIQELALTLLVRLGESDRPSLAQDLALQTIISRPEASSWHRQLLKLSYLRNLSHSDVKACCEGLAQAILAKMPTNEDKGGDGGAKAHDAKSSVRDSTNNSFVKVTTIKFLAQLLRDADFVEEDFAFSVLSNLLKQAAHRDVRVNTAQTLLNMFETSSKQVAENALAILETLIPLAGNLNESKPVTEEEWKVAEETLELPEYPGIDDSLPLFELFFSHYSSASKDSDRLPMFIERLLLPTLAHRQSQIARWLSLFLKKHDVDEHNLSVPSVPQRASVLLAGEAASYIPRRILEDEVDFVEFKIAPPGAIKALHERLRADPAMLKRSDVQTWFELFGSGADALHTFRGVDILSLFEKSTKLPEHVGITPHVVRDQFLKIFKAAVLADAPMYARLPGGLLANLLKGNYLTKFWWPSYGKRIVAEMITYVESLRTDSWLKDANRNPALLPDTFLWRLLLLDFPWPRTSGTGADKCKPFVDQFAKIVNGISITVYHKKLQQIKDFLKLDPVSSMQEQSVKKVGKSTIYYYKRDALHDQLMKNRLTIALHLGEVDTKDQIDFGIADLLRIEIASHLLGLAEDDWGDVADVELQKSVIARVDEWKTCGSEEIRRIGYGLEWVAVKSGRNAAGSISTDSSESSMADSSSSGM
jgi:hypothetical protein